MLITIFPRSNAMVFLKNNCSLVLYWHYIANNVCLFFILVVVHSIETWIWVMNSLLVKNLLLFFFVSSLRWRLKKNKQKRSTNVIKWVWLSSEDHVSLFYFEFTCIANIEKNTFSLRSLFVYNIKSLSTYMKDFAECCGMVPPFLNPIWSMYISHFMPNVFQRSNRFYLYIFSFDILLRKKTSYINGQDITLKRQISSKVLSSTVYWTWNILRSGRTF